MLMVLGICAQWSNLNIESLLLCAKRKAISNFHLSKTKYFEVVSASSDLQHQLHMELTFR
jgi:hypothetical protein